MKTFTTQDVEAHKSKESAWLIVDNKVYDITNFDHPGGKKVIMKAAGTNASEQFWQFHNKAILEKQGGELMIGTIGQETAVEVEDAKAQKEAPVEASKESAQAEEEADDRFGFGSMVPFTDPYWYQDWHSPFYKDSHIKLRRVMRKFTDTELTPYAHEWDEAGHLPKDVFLKVAKLGVFGGSLGGGWPSKYIPEIKIPGGVPESEWDSFHEFIICDELCRSGSGGIIWGLLGGLGIGLPPVELFGSEEMKQRVIPPCLRGEKRICLAITEPSGGSDVANLVSTAEKTEDGKHYIVNGEKKWITNGIYADYFTVAVRTGKKGFGGISMILVEKDMPGVSTRKMNCSGVWASGTSYVTFEDVKVPVENLIGGEGEGFKQIMRNFAHERIGIAIQANRFARVCYEDAMKWACKRITFGQKLIDNPLIRNKFAHMVRMIEATHAWMEVLIYQSTQADAEDLMLRGGGPIALLKLQATQTFSFCAAEATQIFGGLAYTRGGQGERVERLYREVRAHSIPGGSEEIMADLGIRQSLKIAEMMGAKL